MRKLAKVLLAGVAALSLTACGQAEGTTGSSADTTAKEQKQQETPEKIKIQSLNANGEEISLEVPYDPERIAVWIWQHWISWIILVLETNSRFCIYFSGVPF